MSRLWNVNFIRMLASNFLLFVSFYLVMPLLPIYMSETFGADKQDMGIILSGFTLTALLARPYSGYIVDAFDRKKVLLLVYGLFAALFLGYLVATSILLFAVVRTLHGIPYAAATVSNSTVAIDSLPSERRTEGIGFYGLSNNLATAIAPTIAISLYSATHNFDILFGAALGAAIIGLWVCSTVKTSYRPPSGARPHLSLDRLFLLEGWSEGIVVAAFGFCYGVLSTYLAIYGKEEMGITSGTGTYFALLAGGLMLSRLIGSRSLRRGRIVENASGGMVLSIFGYLLFTAVPTPVGYYGSAIIIGLGNGHMYPAMQNMFICLAPNSKRGTANATMFTSWDVGMGLGILIGGAIAEHFGYHTAFWVMLAVNISGVLFFFSHARGSFKRRRIS